MDCILHDLPMKGYQYTWTKGLGTVNSKEERLDRILVNQHWLDLFPAYRFINGVSNKSDHSPLWLHLFERNRKGMRGFRFENAWLEEQELSSIVEGSWSMCEGSDFLSKINQCTSAIDE